MINITTFPISYADVVVLVCCNIKFVVKNPHFRIYFMIFFKPPLCRMK